MAQPELSKEVLPPDSDCGVLEPLCGCAAGVGAGAGAGAFGGLAAGGLTGVGGGDAGGVTVVAGVVTATAGVLGAEEAGAGCEVELVVEAALADVECAGADTATTGSAIDGELARRTGIAGPVEAVETLAGSCSRGALAGRSERPIAKKAANTATQSSIATTTVRAYVATGPRSPSNDAETRTVFMTDTRSGWSPQG
jgi:hypothetical protein